MIDRLELTSVNGNQCLGEQAKATAHAHKLTTNPGKCLAIVLAELADRLVVWCQTPRQPHHLHVTLAFPLKPTAGGNAIEVAVDVDLQKGRRVIRGSTRRRRFGALETQRLEIQLVDKRINQPHWIVFPDVVIEPLRKQRGLAAVFTFNETGHFISNWLDL